MKQNDPFTEDQNTLQLSNDDLHHGLDELLKEKVQLEKQALVNNEVIEVSHKTILNELQEARETILRLTAHHARSLGWLGHSLVSCSKGKDRHAAATRWRDTQSSLDRVSLCCTERKDRPKSAVCKIGIKISVGLRYEFASRTLSSLGSCRWMHRAAGGKSFAKLKVNNSLTNANQIYRNLVNGRYP